MQPLFAGIGAANADLSVRPLGQTVPGDSNPANFSFSAGGVMRNICENAARLGVRTELFAAVGDDSFGELILSSCERSNVGTSMVKRIRGASSSAYVSLLDERGEMTLAFSDMTIASALSPDDLERAMPTLSSAAVICMDGNPSREFIAYAAKRLHGEGLPLFLDPVSTSHAKKFEGLLGFFDTVKPNRLELAALSGQPADTDEQVTAAAKSLIERGVRRVFVTLGEQGVYAVSRDGSECRYRPAVVPMKNATGAGDAFTAGLISSFLDGLDIKDTLRRASACASLAVSAAETVAPDLSVDNLANYTKGEFL